MMNLAIHTQKYSIETAIKQIVEHMALAEVEDQAKELQARYLAFAIKHR
jgi:hypothetical protein